MKILMVTRESQADKRYGLGQSLMPLIEEFRLRGIMVDYICQTDLGVRSILWQHRLHRLLVSLTRISKTDTDFLSLLYGILERFNMGRLAAKQAAKYGHTHVHCHDPIIAAGFRFFARFNSGCRAIWGVTEHGFGCYAQAIHEDGARLGRQIMRVMRNWEASTLLAASWVIAPTRSGIAQLAGDLGISPAPASWHSVVHARPVLNHYSKEAARNQLGWDDAVYMLGVGRIAPVKQFPLLVEACSRLKIKKDLQLVILGEGDSGSLQELARRLGLSREIMFATTENMGLYLCAADLYVSASASESFGLANLEALVAGTAAVCTAVGGVPEVVGGGALLAEPTLESLTRTIQCLLDDDELRKAIAQKGHARAEIWPNIIEITDAYEAIYRQAAASQDSPAKALPVTDSTDSN
ncbi:glycosyltransferase family 4 protein [Nitrosomonas sp. Nm58]|uniref:glycosyltransferase family 4 protein n=1 Tax=Nitrosomonas sp. Nm58 TaxID=200126 RepID=UPI000896D16D|nr:glycosyltransferase family 4 protein [Nitrosomonas sp. Nm58]SDY12541.1 Glycosyltransferase involved in cell wall bisynthesis [Nitrosomonas sp. Nm58]